MKSKKKKKPRIYYDEVIEVELIQNIYRKIDGKRVHLNFAHRKVFISEKEDIKNIKRIIKRFLPPIL